MYISLIVLTFVICTCTMTFAYGSVNMDYVLLLNLNPGNIRGLNQTLNSQGIDIPSPIRTLCIPWCNIVPIDHLTILGRFKSWGYTSCLCRVMECGNRKPCSLGIGNGPVLWTPIGAIGYNLQSEGHVRGYELWDSANINGLILSRWKIPRSVMISHTSRSYLNCSIFG